LVFRKSVTTTKVDCKDFLGQKLRSFVLQTWTVSIAQKFMQGLRNLASITLKRIATVIIDGSYEYPSINIFKKIRMISPSRHTYVPTSAHFLKELFEMNIGYTV